MKNKLKRRISGVMAFLMCCTTLLGSVPVHAATQTSTSIMFSFPREGDTGAGRGTDTWGHSAKSFMNGWEESEGEVFTVHAQDSYTGQVCYCIEPGRLRRIGDTYSGFDESFWDNYPDDYNKTIQPSTIKVLLGRIMQYGYQGNVSLQWKSQNESDADKLGNIMATQILVWETIVGERDADFKHVGTGGKDTVKSMIGKGNPCYNQFIAHYDRIVASVKSHTEIPSFMKNRSENASEFELSWNGNEYATTLTDTNGVLSKYDFSANVTGVSFSKSENKLTIAMKEAPKDVVKITATKNQQRAGVLVWSDTKYGPKGGIQDVSTYSTSVSDSISAYVNVKVSYGGVKIVKTSEDGNVEGVTFTIKGDGVNQTVTTNSKGEVQIDNLVPGTYTITEHVADKYESQEVREITVVAGQVATVNFKNVLKRGELLVTKTSEDGEIEGITFTIEGNGIKQTVTTNSKGEVKIANLLPGIYTVTEHVADKYESQEVKKITVVAGQTTTVNFKNVLKRGDLLLIKTSEDGKVEGVTFTIEGEGIKQTVTTNSKGEVKIANLLPEIYTVTEHVSDKYESQEVKKITVVAGQVATVNFKNVLKRGDFLLIKTSEDGKVEGVTFTIEGEGIKQTVTTNSKGEVKVANLLPGIYTVTEHVANEYESQETQKITVKADEVTTVTFKNVLKRGELLVIKTSEDGKVEGVTFTIEGNGIKQTVTTDNKGEIQITDLLPGIYTITEHVADKYESQETQKVTVKADEVTTVTFKNVLRRGELLVIKTSEDGKVEGVAFTIEGEGLNATVTTNSKGEVKIDNLLPGTYTITEQVADKYEPQEVKKVTVVADEVTMVTFKNILKRGNLIVTKTSEDGLNKGVKFRLFGTSYCGLPVDVYAITDANGVATFEGILIGTGYTLEEVDTAIRYVISENQSAAIDWNAVTNKSFTNILKKFNVTVTKKDKEMGVAQGEASLAGAKYGIYKGEQLVDTYVTDQNGQFTTSYYVCGDDWNIRELEPSEGYLLDTTSYHVGSEPKLYFVEYNTAESVEVFEQVQKGKIAIIKHTDNGETQIETPEAGATFEVYLKSAGSYNNAKENERDTLICDENGFAETKNLPYGVYTVHQTSGWENRETMKDFDVFVAKDGEVYRYIINNAGFESFLKIVKVDAETGKTIAYAGAGFEIYRPDGSKVEMTFTYPSVTTIDTFYTNDEGILITPETLEYGKGYTLVEVQAPYGYILKHEPVKFDVTEDNTFEESAVKVVKVELANFAQKGVIKISKYGEVFSSVTETEGMYQPVYEIKGLAGATYEIIAAEDIVTLDGTLHYKKDEVVDSITTDADGMAISKVLYLGKYNIREIEAPYGMVLNKEVHQAELSYAGQAIEITETSASFTNERQKASISLSKVMEQNEQYGIGMNHEVSAVTFGLFAATKMTAYDGSVIPADGLLEIVSVNEEGVATLKTDLPFGSYYLKEMSTDCHYILDDAKYEFAFEYAGQESVVVEIKVNNGESIKNELIYGEVHGMKKGEDDKGLAGAIIGIFHKEGTEPIMTTISGEDGSFTFTKIPYGEYVVREMEAPEGYVKNETSYTVDVDKNGKIVEIELINVRICGNVQLTKFDADYPENTLSGAEFEVYQNGELIGKMEELAGGVYQMNDLCYGEYTLKEVKAPEGFYLDTNTYEFVIKENGTTVVVEHEAGKGFINHAQTGSIRIEKTSEDGVLQGFRFKVEGTDIMGHTFTAEYVTDKNGLINIEGLRIGEYVISEIADENTESYILPADVTVTVKAGEIAVAKFHNELKPVIPDIPKTADSTNIRFWACMMIASAIGAAGCAFITFRKKK